MSLSPSDNPKIFNAIIDFISSTKRLDKQLFKMINVVSTAQKQANNQMGSIICFLSNGYLFFFCIC